MFVVLILHALILQNSDDTEILPNPELYLRIAQLRISVMMWEDFGISKQGRQEGGQLGQFALGPTVLGVPYSPMSLLSCKNVFNHR